MRAGRIITVIVGALLSVAGFGAVLGGGAMVGAHLTLRDDAGYYNTPTERFQTATAALTTTTMSIAPGPGDWSAGRLGTLRVQATAGDQGPIFVGIAPANAVDGWLAGTDYERITDVRFLPYRVQTQPMFGSEPAGPPTSQHFWAASVSGIGQQTLTWPIERGHWTLVLMNANGQAGVTADVSVGAKTGALLPLGLGLGVGGLLLLGVGIAVMLTALRRFGQTGPANGPPAGQLVAGGQVGTGVAMAATVAPDAYPVRLDGRLDPALGRWMWLVKWLLAIPHLVVLAFLWLAVVMLTVVAGVAILFTGRYPRSIFEFNVGVMRWTWRVQFYAFGALGTDRYPPFSLDRDPNYPADFVVDYPQRLSRGLVLVKWWLLAIPHFLVVAVFAGGWLGWSGTFGASWQYTLSGGLISLLVIVALVVLAFTGRYPQPIFDFVMGMNRWCYRVYAYVGLMRDEYPPFRLDNGGTDPAYVPEPLPPLPDRSGEVVGAAPR